MEDVFEKYMLDLQLCIPNPTSVDDLTSVNIYHHEIYTYIFLFYAIYLRFCHIFVDSVFHQIDFWQKPESCMNSGLKKKKK